MKNLIILPWIKIEDACITYSTLQKTGSFSPLQKTGGLPPLAFAAENGTLVTSGLYRMINASRDPSQQTKNTFWNSRAPPRVQFFTWLLLHGSLQCKTNLFEKNIVDVTCDLCTGHLGLWSICCSSAPFQRPFGSVWASK